MVRLKQMARILPAFVVCAFAFSANASEVPVLGRTIDVVPAAGFCELGDSPGEQQMMDFQRKTMDPLGMLLHYSVPCDELTDALEGRREIFSRWVMVVSPKRDGQLRLLSISREAFVNASAGNLGGPPPDLNEINREAESHLKSLDLKPTVSEVRPLGKTNEAFFAGIKMSIQEGEKLHPLYGITAVTSARQVPILIQSYVRPDAKGESAMETAKNFLRALIDKN